MLNYILLQAAPAADMAQEQGSGNSWSFWVMMILIFVVFYFFMIRPQTKKQKELQKQREAMKKGDKVLTAGGIYGEIKDVQENAFIVTIAKDITIKVDKGSVYAVEEPQKKDEDSKKKDEDPKKKDEDPKKKDEDPKKKGEEAKK